MNDVSNRAVREFSEFLNSIEADFPKPTCTTAYEITMKSTIVSALITLDTGKQMDERFWNHLRVQRNILDFLYALWLDDDRTLVDEFSTILKDLEEYDFSIAKEQMKVRLNIACNDWYLHGTCPKKIGSVIANAVLPARMPGLSLV